MIKLNKRKKILVTGAEGFIGSHLVERLLQLNYEVNALVLYNSFSDEGWLSDVSNDYREKLSIFFGDIRDVNTVDAAIEGCDTVIHLASLITIPYSYKAPASYFETNVIGTVNVLSSAKKHGVSRIVHTSTSEVYGSAQRIPICESHPIVGQSPYSASKIGADQAAYSFFTSFELPIVIARPFNTFGPRQSGRAIIPTIISQILAGRTSLKLGDVTTTRDFNYVSDTINGLIMLAETDVGGGEVYNIGSGLEITIADLCGIIAEISDREIIIETDDARRRPPKSEVTRLCADNNKIAKDIGWKPVYSGREGLIKGLRITFKWLAEREDLAAKYSEQYRF